MWFVCFFWISMRIFRHKFKHQIRPKIPFNIFRLHRRKKKQVPFLFDRKSFFVCVFNDQVLVVLWKSRWTSISRILVVWIQFELIDSYFYTVRMYLENQEIFLIDGIFYVKICRSIHWPAHYAKYCQVQRYYGIFFVEQFLFECVLIRFLCLC